MNVRDDALSRPPRFHDAEAARRTLPDDGATRWLADHEDEGTLSVMRTSLPTLVGAEDTEEDEVTVRIARREGTALLSLVKAPSTECLAPPSSPTPSSRASARLDLSSPSASKITPRNKPAPPPSVDSVEDRAPPVLWSPIPENVTADVRPQPSPPRSKPRTWSPTFVLLIITVLTTSLALTLLFKSVNLRFKLGDANQRCVDVQLWRP